MRDGLLDIMSALEAKDVKKAREVLGKLDTLVGPHFRFEEEALYPALRVFLGEYVDELLKEHGGVIETARTCAELLEKESLTDEEARQAIYPIHGSEQYLLTNNLSSLYLLILWGKATISNFISLSLGLLSD